MSNPTLLIVGGGLAGLSAGCYARANDFDVTIVEHNLQLGGVCTAWHRGPYLIDGCIHWLTGGPFQQIYEELGIVPAVPLHTLERFYMAGQWVEPGGGVPLATMSGRHVVEIICAALDRPFVPVQATVARTM
jgi:phytoene dehydrogenase-like protein